MTSEFEENDMAEEEAEEEAEYETGEEAEYETEEEAEYEEAEYETEEEAESETEENHEHDTEIEEQQIEKNIEHEVEQKTNTKKRSWVWEHFTYDETVKKAKCKHCKSLITCNKGSTSGMAGHIKSKHKLMNEKEKKQLTIRESINNSEIIVSIMFFFFFEYFNF
jgi:hypothetical protein